MISLSNKGKRAVNAGASRGWCQDRIYSEIVSGVVHNWVTSLWIDPKTIHTGLVHPPPEL